MSALTQNDVDVSALLQRLDERTEKTEEMVGKLAHVILEGNGTPALTVQIATLTEKVKSLEDDASHKRLNGGDKAVVYATAIGGFITLAELIVRHLK